MLVAVAISTTEFRRLQQRWAHHEALKKARGITATGTTRREEDMPGGLVLLVDWPSKAIVRSVQIPQAAGVIAYRGGLLVSANNKLWVLSESLEVQRCIAHRWFNNLHGLAWDGDTRLAVASSGIDTILFLDPTLAVVDHWCAVERGFAETPLGGPRQLDLELDHSQVTYSTLDQTTHVNSLLWTRNPPRAGLRLWATFFHQGAVFDILPDRAVKLLPGLSAPHGIVERRHGEYAVADTAGGRIVEFVVQNNRFGDRRVIDLHDDCDWIQDIEPLANGYLVADCNHCRIVEVDRAGHVQQELRYDPDWKIQSLTVLG